MNFFDFQKKPNLAGKVYLLNGDEDLFKFLAKDILAKSFADLELTYVDSELEPSEFYEKIESLDLIPHPKLFYINNTSGNLSKQKQFWNYVSDAPQDTRYIINQLSSKQVEEGVETVEVLCEKVRDNQKEVGKIVHELLKSVGLAISPTDVPLFYALYKNNLFAIYQELQKCKVYAQSLKCAYLDTPELRKILSPPTDKDPFIFANAFMARKLKTVLLNLPDASEFVPQFGNVFATAEKILVYKSAKSLKQTDDQVIKNYEFNQYYFKYTVQNLEKSWSVSELRQLMLEIEDVNLKIRRFNFPVKEAILNFAFRYCR